MGWGNFLKTKIVSISNKSFIIILMAPKNKGCITKKHVGLSRAHSRFASGFPLDIEQSILILKTFLNNNSNYFKDKESVNSIFRGRQIKLGIFKKIKVFQSNFSI